MRNIIRSVFIFIIAYAISLWLTTVILDKYIFIESKMLEPFSFAIIGFMIGLINKFIKPILKIISFPLVLITAGIFTFIINGLMFYAVEILFNSVLTPLEILIKIKSGIISYVIISSVFSTISIVINFTLRK